jgi:hypothetical protein
MFSPPFIERVGRLHVVMAVAKAGGFAWGVQPVGINQRVAGRITGALNHPDIFEAYALQLFCQQGGSVANVVCVLGEGRNTGNAQQPLQLFKKTALRLLRVFDCCHPVRLQVDFTVVLPSRTNKEQCTGYFVSAGGGVHPTSQKRGGGTRLCGVA